MADGYTQVAVDGAGDKIDTNEFVRGDGVTINRQRVDVSNTVTVTAAVLDDLLLELRILNFQIATAFNLGDPALLRADPTFTS